MEKTNAVRLCEAKGIEFSIFTYGEGGVFLDGITVAEKIGKPYESVFKTLVTVGRSGQHYVFMIPVDKTLDLKKASKAVSEKAVEMIPVKNILKLTGYVKGGCSPIGMKKSYPTIVDETIILLDEITFSAGKIGMQLNMSIVDFSEMLSYEVADIVI
ncbi:Cys-tRNA(Pro) deacylase [Fusibacter ferrireducens]|uniref:Cys-tRNA(Pro)/Cys-tRNA(Cys) deacylase n=1 Tax=Fusibacter ferrireducens TaxID=2785058 RepID=A0ABR9ZUC3_9FIRM|nr:Cys-tRNA(Pro) deacylase [Fusibacter ferrireducens]MBF4693556.1 Cys-tRNA(Pro) deacylase [Fusibacter ferrireducens]